MGRASEIEKLVDTTVGESVLSSGTIGTYIGSDSATVFVMEARKNAGPEIRKAERGAAPDGEIVGVSIGRKFTGAESLSEHPYFHSDPAELSTRIDLTDDDFPVGSVLVSCIAKPYQGEGLGRRITRVAIDSLREDGLTPILQFEWDRPDSPGVEKMKAAGYAPQTRLVDHFPSDWNCGACSSSPDADRCSCDLVVFLV